MLTVVLLKKIYCTAKTSHSSRRQTSEAFRAKLQTPELWFAGILECVVCRSFYATKNFLPLYAPESGISILWVGFFYNARIDSSYVSSVWSPFDRQYSLLTSRLFRNATDSLLTGNVDIGKKTKLLLVPPVLAFGLAQALISLSPLVLFAKRMDVLHTGADVGLICAQKNCGKVTRTILSGWLIYRHDFSLMLWNMSALLAFWIFGL